MTQGRSVNSSRGGEQSGQQGRSTGFVSLVGAGPGDPELLTLKALRRLQSADVVLADRLVSPVILEQYVPAQAEVIPVGKQCRRGASTPQATINELLVHYARAGKRVVRLKGGDVSIFSNVLDELQTLVAHEIPYEIIPGITAALGAAAYSGIPLTARGYSTAVRFLTYYKSDVVTSAYWQELAHTTDTLVFYMSAETLCSVVAQLLAHGMEPDTGLTVIEQATTPFQKVYTCSLKAYENELGGLSFKSPSLVIVGKVTALHQQFAWLQNASAGEDYFRPVEGKLVGYEEKAERA